MKGPSISKDILDLSNHLVESCVHRISSKKIGWYRLLKVSKFQKQIILSSHSPKNQRNFSHFSALASKKSWKIVQTQDESTKILIWCYLTQWNSFIALIRPLLKARAKNVKNFVGFLGNEKTRLFAFEIYWPLAIWLKLLNVIMKNARRWY